MVFRAFVYFIVIAVVAAVAAWFAGQPGTVAIDWRGWRVDTSLGVLLLGAALLAAVAALVYRFWRSLVGAPRALGRGRRERRRRRGQQALARGLVAVAAGDPDEARRQARLADALLEAPPLTALLVAQAAQLEGNESEARRHFAAMLERPETEFLGLRGLLMQAQRDGDDAKALELVRRAHRLRPRTAWVLTSRFDLEAAAGNWTEAESVLKDAVKHQAIPAEEGRRSRAAVLLQRSLAADAAHDKAGALKFARKAYDVDRGFQPAALELAARLLAEGKTRAVARLIEEAWARTPHPELARLYGQVVPAKDAVRRLQAMEKLKSLRPNHVESHLTLARAALDARLWGEARRHLKDAAAAGSPSARLCRLMAEVEEAEHGNTAAARQWLTAAAEAPPDPGWVCDRCGAAAPAWNAICGHCGAFGSIDWRAPPRVTLAIEAEAEAAAALARAPEAAAEAPPAEAPAAEVAVLPGREARPPTLPAEPAAPAQPNAASPVPAERETGSEVAEPKPAESSLRR